VDLSFIACFIAAFMRDRSSIGLTFFDFGTIGTKKI